MIRWPLLKPWFISVANYIGVVLVEVLGRYSNHPDQGERIARLLEIVPNGQSWPKPKTLKQVHRRLTEQEIEDLVDIYRAGSTLRNLAQLFKIHRETVGLVLDRAGVDRQDRRVTGERLHIAIERYSQGDSLVTISRVLEVSAETVRQALKGAGIPMRPRQGWT